MLDKVLDLKSNNNVMTIEEVVNDWMLQLFFYYSCIKKRF
jgi:hypothetical protein